MKNSNKIEASLVKKGVIVARRDLEDRYWWGDSAIKLIGSPGEDTAKTGAKRKIEQWLDEIAEVSQSDGGVPLERSDLPAAKMVIDNYRQGCSAVPPQLRDGISISAARALYFAAPFERVYIIDTLRTTDEPITQDSVRETLKRMRELGISQELNPDRALTWDDIEAMGYGDLVKVIKNGQ